MNSAWVSRSIQDAEVVADTPSSTRRALRGFGTRPPARSYAASYLKTGHKPSGYRCRNYGAETKLKFRCSRGVKVFFAIRR